MNFIINKEEYLNAITAWNKISNRDATDHIIYNVIRGHNPSRGFTPMQNQQKLSNGANPDQGYITAKQDALWKIRDLQVTNPARRELLETGYKQRIESLSKRYGIEFTPELISSIKGALQ